MYENLSDTLLEKIDQTGAKNVMHTASVGSGAPHGVSSTPARGYRPTRTDGGVVELELQDPAARRLGAKLGHVVAGNKQEVVLQHVL